MKTELRYYEHNFNFKNMIEFFEQLENAKPTKTFSRADFKKPEVEEFLMSKLKVQELELNQGNEGNGDFSPPVSIFVIIKKNEHCFVIHKEENKLYLSLADPMFPYLLDALIIDINNYNPIEYCLEYLETKRIEVEYL